jgi:hypothetical protein
METKRAADPRPAAAAGESAGQRMSNAKHILWSINIPNHEPRSDSPVYTFAREYCHS